MKIITFLPTCKNCLFYISFRTEELSCIPDDVVHSSVVLGILLSLLVSYVYAERSCP
jgi:hypothetical protein